MLLSCRILPRSMFLLFAVTATCAAQSSQSSNQFQNVAQLQPTGGRVASFVTGFYQTPPEGTDFLYINAPSANGAASSVAAGELLNQGGAGFANLLENQILFTNVFNAVATTANFAGFGAAVGYAFALTPSGAVTTNLCIYAGTGAQPPSVRFPAGQGSSYDVGLSPSNYPPLGGKSGCTTFSTLNTPTPATFGYIVPMPFKTNFPPQLLVEDTANGIIYVLTNDGSGGANGRIPGVTSTNSITLPPGDGPGPMYTADLNGDGFTDLVVNNQTGLAATVYLGKGDGTFQPPTRITFGGHIHSLLLQDMNHDNIPDMIAEVDGGVIEIHLGIGSGTFQATSSGGTIVNAENGLEGNGGHLVGIANINNDLIPDIVTTTPIGLSVLLNQGNNQFKLTNIYNIGPGRNSYALGDFYGTNSVDLAVDSAEGIAIVNGNGNGTFQTSLAYAALAPALSATVGVFRNANNPARTPDVVVGTGATQAQLMVNSGAGTFTPFNGLVNTGAGPGNVPATVWSNVFAGDFDGDGNLDVLYSLTGKPQSPPSSFPILYGQYGNGDGTFTPGGITITTNTGSQGLPNAGYVETALADLNGDGTSDGAFSNGAADFTGLGTPGNRGGGFSGLFNHVDSSNSNFSLVATGFFKSGRTSQQDIVFEQSASFLPYVNKQDHTGNNFTPMPPITGPAAPLYPATALLTDVDGDGNGDLVVVYFNGAANATSGSVDIWYGNGDGTFAASPKVLTLSRNYYLGAVGDMNADGLPDLILSDGSLISILYNQGSRSFGTIQNNGQYTNEQHFLAGQGINSISLADVNGDGTADIVAANGGVTISNAVALGGETAASIALTPNPDVNTGGITVLLNHITTSPTTETLVATPEPSGLQATFTLTAIITPSSGILLPTGSVQFSIDGLTVGGPVPVVPATGSSSASYTVPAGNSYTAGVHTISANYVGDSVNSPATATATHTIQSGATTTTLYLCIGPTPSCPSNASVIAPAPPYPTSLSMYFGQSYNGVLGATANDASVLSPTSVIDFNDNYNGVTTTLCTITIGTNAGSQCLPPVGGPGTTPSGIHVLTGVYTGDAAHTPSSSPSITINVSPDLTTATLTGAPNPSPQGQPVTFTATVTGNFAAPTGPVVFRYGSAVLGTANLVAGPGLSSTATLTTSALPLGTDIVTATYAATLNFNGASASFTETITTTLAGNFTITVTPTPVTVGVGYSTLLLVTVTPQNGFAQGVNLTCANLPTEASCIFDNPSIAAGGGATNLVVTTAAPHTCGTTTPYFLGSNSGGPAIAPVAIPALAGLALLFLPGKRRWLRSLIALAVVAIATQMTGCGTCTDLGTRPATYTFQVVGTATGTSTTQAQSVTLTVAI